MKIRDNIPEIIGIVVTLAGAAVMAGWFLNIEVLKSILPVWVSMKFSTAFSFVLSGIAIYFVARLRKNDRGLATVTLPIISMTVLLVMGSLLASTIVGTSIGVEELFVKDSMAAVGSVVPGRPSISTMLIFILISATGLIAPFFRKAFSIISIIVGYIISLVCIVSIIGYVFGLPLLYFDIPGRCSAMALHTTILFILLAIGLIMIGRDG